MAPVPSTMKAVQISSNGGVEVLQHNNIPVPKLGDGQVLVKNHYAGVNFIDTYFRTGLYKSPHFPLTLGREGAGQVVAVHDSVKDIKPGALVTFLSGTDGSYCEYSAVPAAKTFQLPDGVSTQEGAAALLQGLTAWLMIKESAEVRAGQWALVHAAAGGVGLLLCQMLRNIGAKVIGTASTEEKQQLAQKNGAEWTISSKDDDMVEKVNKITGGHGIDALFDGVGKDTFQNGLKMIARKGHFVSFGNASGAVPPVDILQLSQKNIKLLRPTLFNYIVTKEEFDSACIELFDQIKAEKLNIAVHSIYPLAEAGNAHSDLESRKTTGKLLIKTD